MDGKRVVWSSRKSGLPVFYEIDGQHGAMIIGPNKPWKMAWLTAASDIEMLTSPGLPDKPLAEFRCKWRDAAKSNDRRGLCSSVGPMGVWFPHQVSAHEFIIRTVCSLLDQLSIAKPDTFAVKGDYTTCSCTLNLAKDDKLVIVVEINGDCDWQIRELYRDRKSSEAPSRDIRDYYEWVDRFNTWAIIEHC